MLVIALGIAVGSARIFGVSMALGAFLAGMVVGRSDYSLRAASDALPMRDAFAVLFFVSVGMLLDPASLLDSPWLLAGTLAIVLVGNPAVAFAPHVDGARAVQGRVDRGDRAGADRRVLLHPLDARPRPRHPHHEATNTLVAASIVSIVVNPVLYPDDGPDRALGGARSRVVAAPQSARGRSTPARRRRNRGRPTAHRAVVIGYGPTGRTVVRLLRENGIEPTVVELNIDTVRALQPGRHDAVFGDATRPGYVDRGRDRAPGT